MKMKKRNYYLLIACYTGFLIFFNAVNIMAEEKIDLPLNFSPRASIGKKDINLLVFGDMMLDRNVRQIIKKRGNNYPFEKIKNLVAGQDLSLVNLEGPFTTNKSVAIKPDILRFTFETDMIVDLKKIGFEVFGLANNHTLNFGQSGLQQTKDHIKKNGLSYFGDPLNKSDLSYGTSVNGRQITFVGYNQFNGNIDPVLSKLREVDKTSDLVIVMAHWGNEYAARESVWQKKIAHQLIEAGADIIIGSHPHVIQPIEIYKGRVIYYSLGNFLFDQDFSEATKTGLGVSLRIGEKYIEHILTPIYINRAQISFLPAKKTEKLFITLSSNSIVGSSFKKQIKTGKFSIKFP
jgi:gamma-polyglutamate biosynthesis protein CapA